MIEKLIEKYKEIIEISKEIVKKQRQQRFPDETTIHGERVRFNAYETVIKDLEELKTTTINGYSIEEVITILNGLNLERILDIKMTMENLSILAEKLQENFQKTLDNSMKNMMNDLGDDNNE